MKKILILANNDGGLYSFRKELIEKLVEEKYEVYTSFPDGERRKDIEQLGCHYIETKVDRRGTNIIKDFSLLRQYIKILKKVKPDVVLTYTIKPNIYGGIACRLKKVPYIENITGLGTAVENPGILQKLTLILYRIALKKARCVFFQNEENQNFLVSKKVVKEHYRRIPGSGVNIDKFIYREYPQEDQIHFIFISRIMKQKGIDQYLYIAEKIKEKYQNITFHILGFCEENYVKQLEELQQKGIILYHGLQKDVKPFIEQCHCTIHPSYYPEGMSNVLLESCATGRPIITTNRSGCKEIVE